MATISTPKGKEEQVKIARYSSQDFATPLEVCIVPAGSLITDVTIIVVSADGGTSPTLNVGTGGDADAFIANGAIGAVGRVSALTTPEDTLPLDGTILVSDGTGTLSDDAILFVKVTYLRDPLK